MDQRNPLRPLRPLPNLIFASRWLQLPLYLGLIVAQAIYVWLFWQELYYLLMATFGHSDSLAHVLDAVTVKGGARPEKPTETVLMLVVLGLIDVVMISNLLIMVIAGGYEINCSFTIPPNTDNYEVKSTSKIEKDTMLTSLTPHMHVRGKDMIYIAHYPDGTTETLFEPQPVMGTAGVSLALRAR